MIAKIRTFWASHGTKLWGLMVVATGSAGEALAYIQQLDPKHAAIWGVVITIGCGVIRRGFVNTAMGRDRDDNEH